MQDHCSDHHGTWTPILSSGGIGGPGNLHSFGRGTAGTDGQYHLNDRLPQPAVV